VTAVTGRSILPVRPANLTNGCGPDLWHLLGYLILSWQIACQKVRLSRQWYSKLNKPSGPVYFNFKQHQIPPSLFLTSWFLPIFIDHLPFEACARLWDVILLEGDSFLFRAALGILDVLESRLLFPDRKELLEVLNGESKVAMQVAKRIAPGGIVELGARYEIYGMNEEVLWERIMANEEWWKSSTWTRLIQRELPDV